MRFAHVSVPLAILSLAGIAFAQDNSTAEPCAQIASLVSGSTNSDGKFS
jgi:hypothetical protein